ncbi:Pex24p-domain-containing protein [Thozetella sp. PMI_491]|nr:Pex24p-domain-containing protein [Thozetella sp. PMI_491]
MDELAADIFGPADDAALQDALDLNEEALPESGPGQPSKSRGLRSRFLNAASIQDKLLEKVLSQMIPADEFGGHAQDLGAADDSLPSYAERPGFTLPTMSSNFRRFNARIGVVFKFQVRMGRLFAWRRPTQTLSLLAVYTFVCMDPYLLCVLPLVIALFSILVPSFIARHPGPPTGSEADRVRKLGYSPRGPPLAPARTVKPVKELSRDFFRNMRDLQNSMEDFSVAHDQIIAMVVPKTNFSDEALSSAIFVLLLAAAVVMSIAAHLLPWRYMALGAGWVAIWSGHPAVARFVQRTRKQYLDGDQPGSGGGVAELERMHGAFETWVRSDIILDSAPETREVETFELQRLSDASTEWEPWLFSPSPYDPLSAPRIGGERPQGARFFEDVLPPPGWEWSEKKWALDLWSREWVEERIITGVEVETEGERWVYDIYNEHESTTGLAEPPSKGGKQVPSIPAMTVSWEEGEEGMGRRGEWRRRRWVRMVKRRNVSPGT